MTIVDENEKLKLSISVPHSIMEKQLNVKFSNGTKSEVIMKLINKTFLFSLNKTNTCLDITSKMEKETKSDTVSNVNIHKFTFLKDNFPIKLL